MKSQEHITGTTNKKVQNLAITCGCGMTSSALPSFHTNHKSAQGQARSFYIIHASHDSVGRSVVVSTSTSLRIIFWPDPAQNVKSHTNVSAGSKNMVAVGCIVWLCHMQSGTVTHVLYNVSLASNSTEKCCPIYWAWCNDKFYAV